MADHKNCCFEVIDSRIPIAREKLAQGGQAKKISVRLCLWSELGPFFQGEKGF